MFEQRHSLYGWGSGLFALALLMCLLYPTVRSNPALATLHETYPKALRSLFGITNLATGTGFLRAELFSVVAPMLVIVLAVLWGGDTIAGEEERGTINLLLSNPVTRWRVLLEKWAALLAGVVAVCGGLAAGLAIGSPLARLDIAWSRLAAAILATALLGALFASVALALGAASGRRGLARGVASLLAVASYLLSSLANLISWLAPLKGLSPWYHALGVDPLSRGLQLDHVSIVAAMTLFAAGVAVVGFERRDLAV